MRRRDDRAEADAFPVERGEGTRGREGGAGSRRRAPGRRWPAQWVRRAGCPTTSAPCARRWWPRAARGRRGCAPGTVHRGRASAAGPPLRSGATPGRTGHCHSVAKVRATLIGSGLPSFPLDRSLRRLPRISRMSARSFPLHAWQHRGPHPPCVDHFTVRTYWRITPLSWTRGAPMGRALAASASHRARHKDGYGAGWAPGDLPSRSYSPPPPGEMGLGRRWLRRRVRRQVPGGPRPPLAFTEYVPITTA